MSSAARQAATAQAFDRVAGGYHQSNAENAILRHMRGRVMAALGRHVRAGAALLDLGCGPGTDHVALVRAGCRVTAIDLSPQMVREALARAGAEGYDSHVSVRRLSIEQVGQLGGARFDAALSNFGPLNCVTDLGEAARQIHSVLRPGGVLVASVIGRICPWEIALYGARRDLARATVRWRAEMLAVPLEGGHVWMRYLSPAEFLRTFEPVGFACRHLEGLGVIAPPPYLAGWAERRPALLRGLLAADAVMGDWPLIRSAGDHFLVVLVRT